MRLTKELNLRYWSHRKLPILIQTEAAECGLACLAMVSSYWEHHLDVASLRHRFNVSLKGLTFKGLIAIAQRLGMQARPLKPALEQLSAMKMPCVLHWNMTHFVVLKKMTAKGALIHDPSMGARFVPNSELSRSYTGAALELLPGSGFQKRRETQSFTMRSLMGRVIGLKRNLAWLLVLALALLVFSLATPFFMQWLIDDALVSGDRPLVSVLCMSFIALIVMQTAIGAARSWFTTAFATHLNFQWMGNAFSHLLRLPPVYFEKRHVGDIVSRFGSITTIQHGLTTQVVDAIIDLLMVGGTSALMFWYSPKLAAMALIAVALYVGVRLTMFQPMREATRKQIVNNAKQQTYFLESVRGIQSIKLNGKEDERRVGWMNALADQFNAEIIVSKLGLSYGTLNSFISQVERILFFWLAALMVLDQQFTIGMVMAFMGYKDQFSQRATSLIDKIFDLRMLRLQGSRVADILLSKPEDVLDVEVDPRSVAPSVEFVNVKFRYSDGEPWVLNDVSFKVEPGQFVAFAGQSGCGKTTLIKLMLCLLTPNEGEILIGGKKLKQLGCTAVRQMVGAVMQDDSLFTGSISDNIHFLDPQPREHNVEGSAKLAAIHDEIGAMPMGYQTLVGDLGTGLSGGQKQRILLARALYRTPQILVLDEATSHLDIVNEHLVNQAIRSIDGLTRIVVAHRSETINMAQRVIVLHQGKILRDLAQSQIQAQAVTRAAS
jgi:ATP-binding cassette subfamily B protein RaxB